MHGRGDQGHELGQVLLGARWEKLEVEIDFIGTLRHEGNVRGDLG
jgi:hypothetical protein